MEINQILLALITALLGLFFYERSKRKSAEGAVENIEVKKEVIKMEQKTSKNSGLLEAEEQKREQIKNENNDPTLEEVARYFNNHNNDTKH